MVLNFVNLESPKEVAQSLRSLHPRSEPAILARILCVEQLGADEEYGEYAEPRLYSFFEEVFKRPNVRGMARLE